MSEGPQGAWRLDLASPIHVVQGEQRISRDGAAVLTTLLGSCVAACLRDPVAGIGGMNHFLLPGDDAGTAGGGLRTGTHAMERLIEALVDMGAARHRLEAKLFGGARMQAGLTDIGALNVAFAERFLARSQIAILAACVGGRCGRRVQYWPVSGRARRVFLRSPDLPREAPADRWCAPRLPPLGAEAPRPA